MDDFFLAMLRSIWPVLVPTVTVVIAYLSLRTKHKDNLTASDLRDEKLRGEITSVRHDISLVRSDMRGQISDAVDTKLQRIEDKLDKIGDRVVDLETGLTALSVASSGAPVLNGVRKRRVAE